MKTLFRKWRGLTVACAIAAAPLVSHAVVQVQSLGGGPNETSPDKSGFSDGPTLANAKFNNPYGVAVETNGNLLIADRDNGKIRRVSKPGHSDTVVTTFATKLGQPVGVAVDKSNYVYVVTQRDGKLRKYNSSGTLIQTNAGLLSPTALALSIDGSVFITELSGAIRKLPASGGSFILITTNASTAALKKPRGISVLANGFLAVSESSGHSVRLVNPANGTNILIAGGTGPGFADGDGPTAKFNTPHGIVVAPNGALVVADRLNHRVRVIHTNYNVTTLYGIPKNQWAYGLNGFFPGWVDGAGGDNGVASAREVVGLTITTNGTLYSTEGYWDLVRAGTGTGLIPSNTLITVTNINSTNTYIVLPAPTFSPNSGYFPYGVSITVTSAWPVYYTTDSTEPTTNSRQVQLTDGVGTVRFNDSLHDLTVLRLKALTENGLSPTVAGTPATVTTFGIPRDFVAGSGSTILVPVVANLRPEHHIRSYQFRVEVTPLNAAPPVLSYMQGVPPNDFIPLVLPTAPGTVSTVTAAPYTIDSTRLLLVSASSTNANVDFQHFATTVIVAVPIDPSAVEGDTYRIEVKYPSATSDGFSAEVPVVPGPARTITIHSTPWIVGDVSPAAGYNAGEFGDGDLRNNDATPVLFASVGLRVPYAFSDLFNAMDAYPPEPSASPGGDGVLGFLDWQIVLNRSLHFDPANWSRRWMDGGVLDSQQTNISSSTASAIAFPLKKRAAKALVAPATATWPQGATLSAANIYNTPSGICDVPVSLSVAPGQSVGGLCFRLVVEPVDGAPAVSDVSFTPLRGQNGFLTLPGQTPNDVVCAWSMVPSSPFVPALTGSNVLGRLRFSIPAQAAAGQRYTVRFLHPSGSANLQSALSFEGIPGSAWVLWTPNQPGERTSDEWRQNYFGSLDDPNGADDSDPDGDGVPNWQEYLNGTNPVVAQP